MKIKLTLLSLLAVTLFSVPSFSDTNQSIDLGYGLKNVNAPAAKFEEYKSIPNGFFLDNYTLKKDVPSSSLDFSADKVGQIDQSYNLSVKGPLNIQLSYNQIPHNLSFNAKDVFSNPSAGVYTLPLDLRTYLHNNLPLTSTKDYTALINYASTAEGITLGTRRDILSLTTDVLKDKLFGFKLDVSQEQKNGSKAIGAPLSVGFTVELPEPIKYTTTNVTLHKEMNIKGIELDAKYKYSNFQNGVGSITWDNPSYITDISTASATARLALSPGNMAQEASLNLGADMPMNGRFIASVGYGIDTQNDALLPYTSNTAMTITGTSLNASLASSLPALTPDTRVDTFVEQYAVDLNPVPFARVKLGFRSAQVQNKSAVLSFMGDSPADQSWSAGTEETSSHFYDTKKDNYDVDLNFSLPKGWSLGAGYGIESINLANREVTNTQENIIRTTLRGNLLPRVSFKGSFLAGARRMDAFDMTAYQNDAGAFEEHPGLRRSDVSDRNRQEYNLGINFVPVDTTIMGLSYRNGASDFLPGKGDLTGGQATFSNEMYGLLSQRNEDIGANIDIWLMDESLELATFYDRALVRYQERSNLTGGTLTQSAANDWTSNTFDTYDTVGIDINRYFADDKLIVGLSYWYSAGRGIINMSDVASTAGVEKSPTDTSTLLRDLTAKVEYKVNPTFSWKGLLTFEQFDGDDFAVNNVPLVNGVTAAGKPSPNAIFLGNSLVSYRGTIIQVSGKYVF